MFPNLEELVEIEETKDDLGSIHIFQGNGERFYISFGRRDFIEYEVQDHGTTLINRWGGARRDLTGITQPTDFLAKHPIFQDNLGIPVEF